MDYSLRVDVLQALKGVKRVRLQFVLVGNRCEPLEISERTELGTASRGQNTSVEKAVITCKDGWSGQSHFSFCVR